MSYIYDAGTCVTASHHAQQTSHAACTTLAPFSSPDLAVAYCYSMIVRLVIMPALLKKQLQRVVGGAGV